MDIIEFNHVWKKYKKGERFNSFRDAIPNFFRNLKNQSNGSQLEEREFWAVKDVDFRIKKGEVVGIMGPNGAGKSTVLKLLSRIIVPNQGSLVINGILSALIEVTAGFHPELTGRENVYLNGTILGMKRKEIDKKFDDIIDFSGIGEFIDTPVKRYSSGMFSRLGFSVAAHMEPDILLVDEVLSVGDMAFQAKCAQKMRELLRCGATIVLVSHNLSLIQSLCKRLILINRGELLKDGPTDEVLPYYENIVYAKQEEDFKKRIVHSSDYKIRVEDAAILDFSDVKIYGTDGEVNGSLKKDGKLSITVEYKTQRPIERPIFSLEIIRSDGVLCCSSFSHEKGSIISKIQGKGKITIRLEQLNLLPGIYLLKITGWDKDMIHPFAIRHCDVLRIETKKGVLDSGAIFHPAVEWRVDH